MFEPSTTGPRLLSVVPVDLQEILREIEKEEQTQEN